MSTPSAGWLANTISNSSTSIPTGLTPPRVRFYRHHCPASTMSWRSSAKFGTPVIATADPDDTSALETVRSFIGRDFISVVASRDQISAYLDQLFGSEDGAAERPGWTWSTRQVAWTLLKRQLSAALCAAEAAQVDLAAEAAQVDLAAEAARGPCPGADSI